MASHPPIKDAPANPNDADPDLFRRIDGAIRFYAKIDPKTLTDDEYFEVFEQIVYYRNKEREAQNKAFE